MQKSILEDDDTVFLRELVKASRQKTHLVQWVDRDGSERCTTLTGPEAKRLAILAQREGVSTREMLRRAAHIPKTPETKPLRTSGVTGENGVPKADA